MLEQVTNQMSSSTSLVERYLALGPKSGRQNQPLPQERFMNNYLTFPEKLRLSLPFAVPPILAIFVGKLMFEMLAFDFPQLSGNLASYFSTKNGEFAFSTNLLETKARILWITSVLLYFFVNFGFFSFLWTSLRKYTQSNIALLTGVVVLISMVEILYFLSVSPLDSPIKTIFHFTFDALSASTLLSHHNLQFVYYTLNLINIIAIVVAPMSIVTGCCVISQTAQNLDQLNTQFLWLKNFIKGSSAVMITGIIHMQLWLSWPLSLIPEFPQISELKEVVLTVIQYWGICYSLTIAALYFPLSTYLYDQAKIQTENLEEHEQPARPLSWFDETLSVQSATGKIPQIVAILGPMLIGSLSPAMTDLFAF